MIYIIPVIGALIGWVTNYIAVKMLFHPREPFRLFFLFPVQGVFPKRQKDIAKKLGTVVSTELFSIDDVKLLLERKASSSDMRELVGGHIDRILQEKLTELVPMITAVLPPELYAKIKEMMLDEVTVVMKDIVAKVSDDSSATFDVHQIVEDKVNNFSSDKLEEILFAIMRREFRFIELVGAVLGFLIGVTQVLLLTYVDV